MAIKGELKGYEDTHKANMEAMSAEMDAVATS